MTALLKPSQVFAGKRILFTGATGFVGKVCLSMLLDRFGQALDQVHVLVRRGSAASAERRFFDKVATSEPFEPLRTRYGGESEALDFLQTKCSVLDGDITDPLFGLTEAEIATLKGKVDLLINCAGLVSFDPSLEVGLRVNTRGVQNAVGLCQALGDLPILHVSTSFVAGNRSGLVFEDEEVRGYFPRKEELDGRDFSLEQELADCDRQVARLREKADDKALTSVFRRDAIERLEAEGRDPGDEKVLRLAVGRERKLWLLGELTRAGMERAKHWGWPNTYTYTKSLGEQVLAGTPDLRYAIVRPSIVESALAYPFPGWNEGFTTSAPLCFASLKGHRGVPASDRAVLDIIPVDQVAGAMLGIAAHTMTVRERRVYQLASGDTNPFYASRSVELVGLYRRRFYKSRDTGSPVLNEIKSRVEPQAVSRTAFELRSAPMFQRGAKWLQTFIADQRPQWGAPTVSAWLDRASEKLSEVEDQADSLVSLIHMFLPFIWENRYVFRCDHTRAVYAQMDAVERATIPWAPEGIDWRSYFLKTHLPGLEKWVFPGLEEETQRRRTTIPAHRDLLELLEASVHTHRHRVALRRVEGDREIRFTYGELDRYAARVASFLLRAGVKPQGRVLLVSESRPEWAFAYFGILRAGATVVPVDPELNAEEVVNLARRADAAACLLSEEAAGSLSNLFRALAEAELPTQVHTLAQAMAGDPSQPNRIGAFRRSASPDDVASLIFTSGTTGNPKGVMLTHRNFTSLVSKLAGRFEVGPGDGLLSVLPLHHTFEFSCGLLTPLARGADITYLDTLNSDRLSEVFASGRITGMIGVPALWQLLHRKLTQELAAGPAMVESGVKALMSAHAELRNRKDVNLGKLLFWPVHRKLGGGRLKFMVSGGAALPQDVHDAFHALGFQLTEGYGLTEAAPVLTVGDRENARRPGSVGRALPGIELRIEQPDADGVGEVLARGPTVMAGYFADAEATAASVEDGWLRTGDLGRLDAEGRLYLAGRKKDLIVDANGKNVHPDELEELYGRHTHIRELSVVGLPDESGGERVACLCVPDYRGRPREEVRHQLEEHFRTVSGQMPFYRRVKVLHFWDGELPRTSTRKVKRPKVVEELRKLERAAATGQLARQKASGEGEGWLLALIADVAQRPGDQVSLTSRLVADLGFDSLMMTELSVALEQAGVPLPSLENLSQLETVADLGQLLSARHRRPAPEARAQEISPEVEAAQATEVSVPAPVAKLGRSLLSFGQRILYGGVFQVEVTGQAFIPQNRNCLVVANHASHLDMGLIKVVLGDQGERLAALAARDYFFDTVWKRAYFENFTNLIPMDRQGSLRESLRLAGDALNQGLNLLIFPEGTRTPTGEIQEFKPTLGFLALTYQVDVLPLYLEGTYDALPRGALFPKQTQLAVRIGPVLTHDAMKRQTEGMARSESYRHVTAVIEKSVRALKEGRVIDPSAGSGQAIGAPPPSKSHPLTERPRRSGGRGSHS